MPMPIQIESRFRFRLPQPADVLLQFEAAAIPEQQLLGANTTLGEAIHLARVPAQDRIGERIWIRAQGEFEVAYSATVRITRVLARIEDLDRLPPHALPADAVKYLFDSRYCPASRFQAFAETEFAGTRGGARIAAIRDWIAANFTYRAGVSNDGTDAVESFVERTGICRDYAHMLVTLARASGIPARYVACYAPGVEPPDFHAVAEVLLADPDTPGGGIWQLVDATGMADPAETVKIGVGRDAAEVSFLTSFGECEFVDSSHQVTRRGE